VNGAIVSATLAAHVTRQGSGNMYIGEILESLGYDEDEIRKLDEKQIIIVSRRKGKDR